METQVYTNENGMSMISVFDEPVTMRTAGASSVRHVATETSGEVLDRLAESSTHLSKRIDKLERERPSIISHDDETGDQAAFTPTDEKAEDEMVARIICLGSSNPALKRKTLDKIEAEGMSREEAQASLIEDAMVDKILKRGGK